MYSFNADVSRLRIDLLSISKKEKYTDMMATGDLFSINRRRDLILIVNTLELLDTIILRGVKTYSEYTNEDAAWPRRNGVEITDTSVRSLFPFVNCSHF